MNLKEVVFFLQKNYIQQTAFLCLKIIFCTTIKIMLRLFNNASLYRIIMDVVHFLKSKCWAVYFLWLIILPPKLKSPISAIFFTLFQKNFKHPFRPTLMLTFLDCFYYLFACKFSKITQYIAEVIIFCRCYK
jgi:hypothetical protein